MSLRPRALPAGFVAPCLPTTSPQPPSGEPWLHEIKHDGFRVIARKNGDRVKLYSRLGDDLTPRFPQIVEALERLRSRSCIIDGEAVACGEDASRCSSVLVTSGQYRRLKHFRQIGADQVAALVQLSGVPFRAVAPKVGYPFAHVTAEAILSEELGDDVTALALTSRALNAKHVQ